MVDNEKISVMDKVCPMPVLMIRSKLKQMKCGQILEIVGNFLPAKDNILRAVKSLGHEVVEVDGRQGNYRIVVKKK